MNLNPMSWIGDAFSAVENIIDDVHTSDEERLNIKAKMFAMRAAITEKVIAYETTLLQSSSAIIQAEANGQSWLQRSWRPITMLTFLGLVVADTFGLTEFRLAQEAWTLLQLGLGGYVVGRSVEKITSQVAPIIAAKLNKEK